MSKLDLSTSSLYNIRGKIALVTGGSSGIGKMIAEGFVQNGAKVYIAARKEAQLKATTEELNKIAPGSVQYIVANVGSKAGCDALIAELKKRESKLHILVNNSGITWGAPFVDFPEAKGWDNVMAVNVKSIFYMTAGLADLLEQDATAADPGRVINISSVAGISAQAEGELSAPGSGVWSYNTSKAAANHLTSQLSLTLVRRHINVNAILPGCAALHSSTHDHPRTHFPSRVFPSKMTAFGFQQVGSEGFEAKQPTGTRLS
ncbi:hypothetical protein HGRIS_013829 [Hohenbuehelia grisea]|uniref:NAD(P)-binding protein n=1 Tax=Hohenbuehelia grisea TaxID=104357 RepID=A0ABR3IWL8_9AGAR